MTETNEKCSNIFLHNLKTALKKDIDECHDDHLEPFEPLIHFDTHLNISDHSRQFKTI